MQYKVIEVPRLKTTGSGPGTLMGYASTWQKDSVGDIVVRGAYRDTIKDWLREGFVALGHDWNRLPIATPKSAVEDSIGLKIEAEFHSTPEAQNARRVIQERLERGKSVKLSIGYDVLDDERTKAGRLLKKLKLWEVSVVNVPANTGAAVLAAKGGIWRPDPATVAQLRQTAERIKREMAEARRQAAEQARRIDAQMARLSAMRKQADRDLELLRQMAARTPAGSPDEQWIKQEYLRLQARRVGVDV
jgi:HK97 family phage prohead protease